MKENEKRFARGAMFRMTSAKREPAFAGTPEWYFDWDTGQYWEKGDKPESDASMDPKEVVEEVENIVREARARVENVVR